MNINGYEITPGADLTDADLTSANLTGADLRGANLTDADLTGAIGLRFEPDATPEAIVAAWRGVQS